MSTTHHDRIDLSPQAIRDMFPVETAMVEDETIRNAVDRVFGDTYLWQQLRGFLSDALEVEIQQEAGVNVVSAYTDTHALIDGHLVDISPWQITTRHGQKRLVDRMTHTLAALPDAQVHVDYAAMEASGPADEDGYLLAVDGGPFGTIWLCINERGNYTAMRPEDY